MMASFFFNLFFLLLICFIPCLMKVNISSRRGSRSISGMGLMTGVKADILGRSENLCIEVPANY